MNEGTRPQPARGRPPAGGAQDRRGRILDCALALFAEQGIAATTDAAIARASGVTAAMVHYYFRSREGLLDCLVAERLAPRMRGLWEGFGEDLPEDPREILATLVRRLFAVVDECPLLPALWNREIFPEDGLLRERVTRHIPVASVERVIRALAAAQERGALDARLLPPLLVTSAFAIVLLPLAAGHILDPVLGAPLDRRALERHALAFLLGGLGGEGGGR